MCGIFGINIGKGASFSKVDKLVLHSLGLAMDSRGGSSYGIYYDKVSHKSVSIPKYKDGHCVSNGVSLPDSMDGDTIIGHTRKPSPNMAINVEGCQPIVATYAGKRIALAHNGTLRNHKELAAKHKLKEAFPKEDIDSMSDSMILARLILVCGFSVLSEYNGAAALMMEITKQGDFPETFIFRGMSKLYGYSDTISEERPIHYICQNGKTYICSENDPLNKLNFKGKVSSLTPNVVYKLKGGSIEKIADIDRSKQCQRESSYNVSNQSSPNGHYSRVDQNSRNRNRELNRGRRYDDFSDVVDHRKSAKNKQQVREHEYPERPKKKYPKNILNLKEELPSGMENYILFLNGRYVVGKDLADGIYEIDNYGICMDINEDVDFENILDEDPNISATQTYYFLKGTIIRSRALFIELGTMLDNYDLSGDELFIRAFVADSDSKLAVNGVHSSPDSLISIALAICSDLPVNYGGSSIADVGITVYDGKHTESHARYFTGEAGYPWSDETYKFVGGNFVGPGDRSSTNNKSFFVFTRGTLIEGAAVGEGNYMNISYAEEEDRFRQDWTPQDTEFETEKEELENYNTPLHMFDSMTTDTSCKNCFYSTYKDVCASCSENENKSKEEKNDNDDFINENDLAFAESVENEALEVFTDEMLDSSQDLISQLTDMKTEKAKELMVLTDDYIASLKSIMLNK